MRLIDADALTEEIHSYTMYDEISKYDIERAIDEAPTVDAEPVRHGRWIKVDIVPGYMWKYRCSCCHSDGESEHDYCQNCGAKMDEVK